MTSTAQKFSDTMNGLRILNSDFGVEALGIRRVQSQYCIGSKVDGRRITFVDGSVAEKQDDGRFVVSQ